LYWMPLNEVPGELALGLLVIGTVLVVFVYRGAVPSERVVSEGQLAHDLYGSLYSARHVIAYTLVAAVIPFVPFAVVTWFLDELVVSTYGAAMRYVGVISLIGLAVNTVLFPSMASLKDGEKELPDFVKKFTKRFLVLVPPLLGLVLLASWVLP